MPYVPVTFSVYCAARRFFGTRATIIGAVFFATQPLVLGYFSATHSLAPQAARCDRFSMAVSHISWWADELIPIPRQYSSLARLAMTVVSEDLPSSVFADADTLGRVAVLAERLHAGAVSDCRVHSSCVCSDRHQLKHYALGLRTTVSMVGASPKNDLRPTKSASRNFTGKVSIQVIRIKSAPLSADGPCSTRSQ